MITETPFHSDSIEQMWTQNSVRDMNEMLLSMGIPERFYPLVGDYQLCERKFIYHVEIVNQGREYHNVNGYTWQRFRFTDHAKTCMDPGWAGDIYSWIVWHQEKYRAPFEEVREIYTQYCNGEFDRSSIPLIMIGAAYGQSVEDYIDFESFFSVFMNKHHYCVTATAWSICKAVYDVGDEELRESILQNLRDPQVVQAWDTLTSGRLMWYLVYAGFIERY